jgi:lysophospholipase L1-like esterase
MKKMIFAAHAHSHVGLLFLILMLIAGNLYSQSNIWVGSWSAAPYAAGANNTPPSPFLANNTLRQIVRVSIGGDSLRVKFSNKTGTTPVTMNSVNIAVSEGSRLIDAATITNLQFNGNNSVTMDPFSSVYSDPVAFALTPSMRVAITIHYGQVASDANITSHVASRTDSYILSGDQSTSASFAGSVVTAHWFHINTIDVLAPNTAGAVGILGNSITDGYGLSGGLQNRWPDIFSEQLLNDSLTEKVGVLNMGIGATNLSGSGPTTGTSRFKDDILSQSGLRWIIIFYGVNDIGGGAQASTLINAYQQMIDLARARNIKIYGATITPFKGSGYYSEAHEAVRNTVNEWIRTPGNFDACIDFDMAIRDPNDPARMLAVYSNDWLHPNASGYAFLGESVDIDLFTEIENNYPLIADAGDDQTTLAYGNTGSHAVKLNGSGSWVFGGNVASYIWSINDSQIATGESPTVNLSVGTHVIKLTVMDQAGNSDSDEVTINVVEVSGVWLEAECGVVGSLWNIETDNQASNEKYVTIKPGNNSTGNAPTTAAGLLTYTFDVEESGTYSLYARVLCPSFDDDSFWIKMDDGQFAMWNGIMTTSWQWLLFPSGYNLTAGIHTLTIGYREDGAKLDKLWITKHQAVLPDEGSAADNCGTTNIKPENDSSIIIYPNPVDHELNIAFPDFPSVISIYNSSGRNLLKKSVMTGNVSINMTGYTSGIYFVKVSNQSHSWHKKIVKL